MLGIAGSECATSGEGYTCDLGIAEVDQSSRSLALSGQRGCALGGGLVEIEYTSFEVFAEHLVKCAFKLSSAPACRQKRDTEVGFEHRDRGDPNRLRRLAIKPHCDLRIRPGVHQSRKHVGVKDNHARFAGRAI